MVQETDGLMTIASKRNRRTKRMRKSKKEVESKSKCELSEGASLRSLAAKCQLKQKNRCLVV